MTQKVFMLMIEPTPYIQGFIHEIRTVWKGDIEVAYAGRNLSQSWHECVLADEVFDEGFFVEIRRLWQRLRTERYAAVHLAGWSHPLVLATLLIAALRRIPAAVETDTPYRAESAGWRPWLKRLLYPWLFRLPKLFLPGGSRQADYFRQYGVPDTRLRIAHMTVDVTALAAYRTRLPSSQSQAIRQRLGLAREAVVFLFVGRLEAHKGIADLLKAYTLMREQTEVTCALLMVGAGPCRADVDAAVGRMEGVVASGRLSGTALWDAYVAADVFVLPSLREPWGLVVNEAMAFGLPVIATDAVGCAEDLIVPEVTGLVVPAHQPAALAAAMHRLAEDGGFRQAAGMAAAEHIRPWTLRREAECVAAAWHEMIDP